MATLLRPRKISEAIGNRVAFVIAGPPGTGKSVFCARMNEVGKTLLLCTHARELESWLYKEYDLDHFLFEDRNWKPLDKSFVANGFRDFMGEVGRLADDDTYDNVIVDSGTQLGELAWHEAMSIHKAASPAEMEDQKVRWLPYESIATNLEQAIKSVVSLTNSGYAKRPKNVGITWHIAPLKDDTTENVGEGLNRQKVQKISSDHAAEGVEYEGNVLPMVRGRFRRTLQSLVPTFVFTDIAFKAQTGGLSVSTRGLAVEYRIQVRPDQERHTKIPGPLPEQSYITNDSFKVFLDLIHKQQKAAQTTAAAGSSKLRS